MVSAVKPEDRVQEWSWKTGDPEKAARMEAYAEWVMTPAPLREPASKQKYADSVGLHVNTLRNYDRDPAFQEMVKDRSRVLLKAERLPAILDSLFEQATDRENSRSVSAAKLLLDFAGLQDDDDRPEKDAKDMSQGEIMKQVTALLEEWKSATS